MYSKIKVFSNYLSSEIFALLQNFYIKKMTFYHLNLFCNKVNKIKVFSNYLSSENFVLLQNSYILKLTIYHLKLFFIFG